MSAALALQTAMVAALKGDAAVAAIVDARVYDRVPEDAVFPYLVIDGVTEAHDRAEGLASVEVSGAWRAWVRDGGRSGEPAPRPRATALAAAVAAALDGVALDLGAAWGLADLACGRRDAQFASDGLTVSSDVPFTALIDPA